MKLIEFKQMPIPYSQIENQMNLWRKGLIAMPQSYIDYHRALADHAVEILKTQGVIIHRQFTAKDGWGDSMMVVHLIVELKTGELLKLKWNDSNSSGKWFKVTNCGSSPFEVV